MPAAASRNPSCRHHKPSNQGVVTLGGREFYFGRYDSIESRAEYDRLIGEWLTNGRRVGASLSAPSSDLTVNEILFTYISHAESYHVKNGKPTVEVVADHRCLTG